MITKLQRYLRWSNLVRKHFSFEDNSQNSLSEHQKKHADSKETNGLTNGNGLDGRHAKEAAPDDNGAGLDQLPVGDSHGSQRHDFSERG